MLHLPQLIQDLGTILVTASIVSLLFKRLKQPAVLGYLVAGILVGPNFNFFPTVQDVSSVKIWAEIGVIILLFGLGLEFSFKKLTQVGKSSVITALIEVSFMVTMGFAAGRLMDWNLTNSLFLGGLLAISSTSIILKSFDELNLKSKRFSQLVFGVLIVEDILAILILVLLSTFTLSQALSGVALVESTAKLSFFLILWFALGIYLTPIFIDRVRRYLNDESALLVSLGLCLSMVVAASHAGFAPALGAFVMGSILAETREGERIEKLIHPIRDLFAAIFFVSVGMLINPQILFEYKWSIIFLSLIVILGKFFAVAIGALVAGQSLKNSVRMGTSLGQIGEFSFIIAGLGIESGATDSSIYPVAVAVSAITSFTTPIVMKNSARLEIGIDKFIPFRIRQVMESYRASFQMEAANKGLLDILWRALGWRMLLNFILVLAIFLFSEKYLSSLLTNYLGYGTWTSLIQAVITLGVASPFVWAMTFGFAEVKIEEIERLRNIFLGIRVARAFIALNMVAFFVNSLLSINSMVGMFVFLFFAIGLVAGNYTHRLYSKIESQFLENLNEGDRTLTVDVRRPMLGPWDVALVEMVVDPNSILVGKTLQQLAMREKYGVMVAIVQRGAVDTFAPHGTWQLMPYDRVFLIGSDEQIAGVTDLFLKSDEKDFAVEKHEKWGLTSYSVTGLSPLVGQKIRDSGLRDTLIGMIVGVERRGQRLLTPDSEMVIEKDDLLWIVGDTEKVHALK